MEEAHATETESVLSAANARHAAELEKEHARLSHLAARTRRLHIDRGFGRVVRESG